MSSTSQVSRATTKLNKGDLCNPSCPSRGVLEHVTSRWGVLIFILLRQRTHRFSDLGRRVGGVSQKMLAQTLQNLEADGFVTRTVHPTVPPQVEYGLTPIGLEAATRVQQLAVWIEDITPKVLQVRAKRVRTPS